MQIDPWETREVEYARVFEEFGISQISLDEKLASFHLFRRGIVFGHRDFDLWWRDFQEGKPVSVLTGMMPSGPFHLGHKMVIDQLVFYQSLGVPVTLALADIEARTVRKKSGEEIRKLATSYLENAFALGLDPKKTDIYFQSNRENSYYRLADLLAGKVTFAEMQAIYGDLSPGKVISALTQASDILHKQLPEFLGKHRVLIPVGLDQDPHIRLARDLADRAGFIKPSATYHRFMLGLDGQKMSSSKPTSYISLDEPVEQALRKARNALTGGRNTVEEQRRLGGNPDVCMVFSLYTYHFDEDDESLERRKSQCKSGKLTCGDCKRELLERMKSWLEDIKEKKERFRPIAEKMVDKGLNYPF